MAVDADARVRLQTLVALGRLGRSEAVAAMIPLTADADPTVAHVAVQALQRLRPLDACLQAINQFGLTHAGKILGVITLIDASAGGLGAWLTNQLFARGQSYALSYQLMFVLMGVAFVAAFAVRRPQRESVPCKS